MRERVRESCTPIVCKSKREIVCTYVNVCVCVREREREIEGWSESNEQDLSGRPLPIFFETHPFVFRFCWLSSISRSRSRSARLTQVKSTTSKAPKICGPGAGITHIHTRTLSLSLALSLSLSLSHFALSRFCLKIARI